MIHTMKNIIFDLDGTLIESMNVWHECDLAFFAKRGITYPDDLWDDLTSNNITDLAKYFKQRFVLPESIEDIMAEWLAYVKNAYEHTITTKPFAMEIIHYLKNKGITLAIGTSNERSLAESVLRRLKMTDLFSTVVVGCDCENGKPAPDIFLLIAEKLGVDPANCLVIEDSLAGVQAAKNAGMTVYAVADASSARDKEQIMQTADRYFQDLGEVMEKLVHSDQW